MMTLSNNVRLRKLLSIGICSMIIAIWSTFACAEVKLSFLLNSGAEDLLLFKKVAKEFEAKNPGIKVQVRAIPARGSDYYQKLTIMAGSNTLPDIFFLRGGTGDIKYMKMGMAADITQFVKRDAKEIDIDDFFDEQYGELQYPKGTWRAMPYDYSVLGIYYNKKLFSDQGIAAPKNNWTWKDVLTVGQKITKFDSNKKPLRWGLQNLPIWQHLPWLEGMLLSEGASLFNNDLTKCVINSTSAVKIISFWRDLALKYHISPRPGEAAGENVFLTGKAGMMISGSWDTLSLRNQVDFPFDVAMLPQSETGKRVVSAGGGGWVISKSCKYKEEAWKFIKYITSKAAIRTLIVDPVRSLPPRKSLLDEWHKNASKQDPKNAWIFAEQVLKYGKQTPLVTFDYLFVLNNKLPTLMESDKSVKSVLDEIVKEVNDMIKKDK